jgi:hypothetical protein
MQFRLNDGVIHKQPRFLTATPTEKDHAIIVGDLLVPMDLHGVISFFHGQKPTMSEYNTSKWCIGIHIVSCIILHLQMKKPCTFANTTSFLQVIDENNPLDEMTTTTTTKVNNDNTKTNDDSSLWFTVTDHDKCKEHKHALY